MLETRPIRGQGPRREKIVRPDDDTTLLILPILERLLEENPESFGDKLEEVQGLVLNATEEFRYYEDLSPQTKEALMEFIPKPKAD